MKNPLLVPELREMVNDHRVDEIRDFASFTPPEATAEFLSAMEPEEGRIILEMLEPDMRSLVFSYLEDESKLPILNLFDENQAAEVVKGMPEEARDSFLENLPLEQQIRLREKFQRAELEVAQPLLAAMDEALAPEAERLEELTPEEIANEVNQHLENYRFVGSRVEKISRPERGCWVRIISPSKDNLVLIAEHFKIPLDFLTAALDLDETARIEIDEQATLFIVKIPFYDEKQADVLYFTIPIGIILVGGMILTVCTRETSILQDFAENRVRHVTGGHRFILQLILRATVRYLAYLKQLNSAANIIQKKLEMESRNKQLIKLFNIEKSLVYFTTSLKSNMLMLERLRRLGLLEMNEINENLIEDIFTECKQAIEMSNIYSDILSGMMDAFASVISNNLNIVMRLLTSITIILTIPILIASFYGMNVPLPGHDSPWALPIIILMSLLLCVLAVVYFVRRRWLEP